MTLEDAKKTMNQINGKHLEEIYIPSLGRTVFFKPLTTADAKTLTRISIEGDFDVNVEMLKLSLFDLLCTEDLKSIEIKDEEGHIYPPLESNTLTEVDYLSFLCGIRQLLDSEVSFTFNCQNKECKHKWVHEIKIEQLFKEQFQNFKRKTVFFEKEDEKTGNIWKFELTDFNMPDYFFFRYMINKIEEKDPTSPEVLLEGKFVRPILYIKNIWLNDELIEDWNTSLLPDKLEFYNNIAPSITIASKNISPSYENGDDEEAGIETKKEENNSIDTIYECIQKNFIEQKIERKMLEYTVKCEKCGREYRRVFSLQDFFIF